MSDGPEEAVDVRGLAKLLSISPDTVRRKAVSGEIPGVRVGRMWRFWPSEVREHLKQAAENRDPWARSPASRRALNRRRRPS